MSIASQPAPPISYNKRMPRFTLKALFLAVTLIAIGIGGLVFRQSESMPSGDDWVWLNSFLLFGSWIAIGEALLVPFWRRSWYVIAGLAFGAWLGIVLSGIHLFVTFRPCH